MKNIIKTLAASSILVLSGCNTTQPTTTQLSPVDQFWSSMKNGASDAKAFLSSDLAKKNSVAFFKIAWQTGLTADALAGDSPADLAKNFIHPFCSVIKSMTSANAKVSIEQISAVASAFGNRSDLSKYGQITSFYAPIFEWITSVVGDDGNLVIFYLNAITDAGEQVSSKYL